MIEIDETYFSNEPVYLTGLKQSNGYSSDVSGENLSALNKALNRFTKAYLKQLLGSDVYSEYDADKENPKWDSLKTVLINDEDKISPIANYVYFFFRHENNVVSGSTGDFIDKMDNMQSVTIAHKLANAWNDGVCLNEIVCKWILDNIINAETPVIELENSINVEGWYNSDGLLKHKSMLGMFI